MVGRRLLARACLAAGVISALALASTPAVAGTGRVAPDGLRPSAVAAIESQAGAGLGVSVTLTNSSDRTAPGARASVFLTSTRATYQLGRPPFPAIAADTSAVIFLPSTPHRRIRDGRYAVRVCLPPTPGAAGRHGSCASTGRAVVQVRAGEVRVLSTGD